MLAFQIEYITSILFQILINFVIIEKNFWIISEYFYFEIVNSSNHLFYVIHIKYFIKFYDLNFLIKQLSIICI